MLASGPIDTPPIRVGRGRHGRGPQHGRSTSAASGPSTSSIDGIGRGPPTHATVSGASLTGGISPHVTASCSRVTARTSAVRGSPRRVALTRGIASRCPGARDTTRRGTASTGSRGRHPFSRSAVRVLGYRHGLIGIRDGGCPRSHGLDPLSLLLPVEASIPR